MAVPTKKTKIVLSDYDFQRDIDNRLQMAQLSTFEVDVLREIINGSLTTSLSDLSDFLQADEQMLAGVLDKLSRLKLFRFVGDHIVVNKEMRKYYESQIVKFEDDFEPGIDYLFGLLSKVPIHILPTWYLTPRMSDNISASIIEKYLLTPKLYKRYLDELNFDNPILHSIVKDVMTSPDYKLCAKELQQKYGLGEEEFQKIMLLLEFHFICCLSYSRHEELWHEVVTPFFEWKEFLQSTNKEQPPTISTPEQIIRFHPSDFGFIDDMAQLLQSSKKAKISVISHSKGYTLTKESLAHSIPDAKEERIRPVIEKCLDLNLAEIVDGKLQALPSSVEWLKMSIYDRGMAIYRHPSSWHLGEGIDAKTGSERNIRQAEKTLLKVIDAKWIYFDDFMKGVAYAATDMEPYILKKITRNRWKYVTPTYTDQELKLIHSTIFNRLYQVGVVAKGSHNGKECFTVTTFGRVALGD